MPARKKPTLYEVVNRTRRDDSRWKLRTSWFAGFSLRKRSDPHTPHESNDPSPQLAEAPIAPPPPLTRAPESFRSRADMRDVASTPAVMEATSEPEAAPPLTWRYANNRLHVSLGPAAMIAAGIMLVSLLAVAFQVGGRLGRSAPDLAGESGDSPLPPRFVVAPATDFSGGEAGTVALPPRKDPPPQQPQQQNISPAPSPQPAAPRENTAARAQPPQFAPGASYLIVQHFPKSRLSAAEQAQAYLIQNGVNCVLVAGGDLRLVATDAFDLQNKDARTRKNEEQRVDGLKKRIKDLGAKYAEHGYAFDQCYTRVMTRD